MSNIKAVKFTNTAQLIQEIADLKRLDAGNYAILASFEATTPNGEVYELSCFIERNGDDFGITEVMGAKDDVDTNLLQFELMHHSLLPC